MRTSLTVAAAAAGVGAVANLNLASIAPSGAPLSIGADLALADDLVNVYGAADPATVGTSANRVPLYAWTINGVDLPLGEIPFPVYVLTRPTSSAAGNYYVTGELTNLATVAPTAALPAVGSYLTNALAMTGGLSVVMLDAAATTADYVDVWAGNANVTAVAIATAAASVTIMTPSGTPSTFVGPASWRYLGRLYGGGGANSYLVTDAAYIQIRPVALPTATAVFGGPIDEAGGASVVGTPWILGGNAPGATKILGTTDGSSVTAQTGGSWSLTGGTGVSVTATTGALSVIASAGSIVISASDTASASANVFASASAGGANANRTVTGTTSASANTAATASAGGAGSTCTVTGTTSATITDAATASAGTATASRTATGTTGANADTTAAASTGGGTANRTVTGATSATTTDSAIASAGPAAANRTVTGTTSATHAVAVTASAGLASADTTLSGTTARSDLAVTGTAGFGSANRSATSTTSASATTTATASAGAATVSRSALATGGAGTADTTVTGTTTSASSTLTSSAGTATASNTVTATGVASAATACTGATGSAASISAVITGGATASAGVACTAAIGAAGIVFSTGASPTTRATINQAGQMVFGPGVADVSALLDLYSTTLGFGVMAMSEAQRDAIGTPRAGLVVYNSTTNKLNVRAAAAWEAITSV